MDVTMGSVDGSSGPLSLEMPLVLNIKSEKQLNEESTL